MTNSFPKKLASSWRAPQEKDAKFRFAIHQQGIRQFHDNCQIAKCQTVVTFALVHNAHYPVDRPAVCFGGTVDNTKMAAIEIVYDKVVCKQYVTVT